ncbi:dicarboxylate/amino acid:cation symporter [Phocaeicola paurosaccharolyticus]|jgi:Na+/H+-dicarboxylate symporter|uniref:dicarboxylate/amino acid:cation symporter n=1 Tax=Phocaeicola paurosaccharolyticus TaxID=732242 RepID=UPI002FE05C4D
MKKIKIGLLPRIIIAIILGIIFGNILPETVIKIFVTFNSLFSQFLGFMIPLIIVGLVAPAIADIGKEAGRMLVITTILAYAMTLLSGFISYATSDAIFPSIITPGTSMTDISKANDLVPFFTVSIPPLMDVMTSLILSFTLGIGIAYLSTDYLKNVFNDFREIVMKTIKVIIIPLLPIYILGIFLNMAYSGQVFSVLTVFIKIIGIIFLLHIFVLLLQFTIAGVIVKRNPLRLLLKMLPAYFTALGTQSSAATIPVTLKQTIKNGVNEDIAGFVIPLCATIHLSGSTLKIVACALALMIMQGLPYDFPMIAGFIFMLGITMVAAPGVPGGAIMASLGILASMLHFGESELALMIALYIAMDSFGTACNVTGDGSIALIIDKIFRKEKKTNPEEFVEQI